MFSDQISRDLIDKGGLSVSEGMKILREAEWRIRHEENSWPGGSDWPEIFWRDNWWTVARTDWKDDICTGLCEKKTKREWQEYYIGKIACSYGVRLRQNGDDKTFAIVDAFSDG